MSVYVLLKLQNELRKSNGIQGLPGIYHFFAMSLINSINTGAQMLDSIYHMKLELF